MLGEQIEADIAKGKLANASNRVKRLTQRRHFLLLHFADELESQVKILRFGERHLRQCASQRILKFDQVIAEGLIQLDGDEETHDQF